MKFSIDQILLKTALQRVLSVVDKKTPNPVLSNILMVVNPQELILTSTNMDIAILEKLPLHLVEKTGASTATISRVKRCLVYGADGYNSVMPVIREEKTEANSSAE